MSKEDDHRSDPFAGKSTNDRLELMTNPLAMAAYLNRPETAAPAPAPATDEARPAAPEGQATEAQVPEAKIALSDEQLEGVAAGYAHHL